MSWPSVALDGRVSDLAGRHVAVRGVGPDGEPTVVLVTFGLAREGGVGARMCDSATRVPMPMVQRVVCPGSVTLRAAVLAHTAVRGTAAAEPPRIRWPISGFRMTVPVTAVMLVLVLGAAVSLSQPLLLLCAIPLIGNVWWQRDGALLMLQPAVIEEGQLMPSQVMARIPAEAELAGPSPLDRVDVVKAAYGRLLGDIVYRIEKSALFDAAQPATSRFQVALASWDPGSVHADQLAQEVEVSFAAARGEAERLGLAHLPLTARGPAQRAVKAVRVALGAGGASVVGCLRVRLSGHGSFEEEAADDSRCGARCRRVAADCFSCAHREHPCS